MSDNFRQVLKFEAKQFYTEEEMERRAKEALHMLDDFTHGSLLRRAREEYGDPTIYVKPIAVDLPELEGAESVVTAMHRAKVRMWYVMSHGRMTVLGAGETEQQALLGALESARLAKARGEHP